MPQLDIATFPSQLFWLALTFLALYFFMAKKGLPKVGEILEEREARIANDLDQASTLKSEGVELEAQYEKALADAKSSATASLKDARDALQAKIDAKREKAEAKIQTRIVEAEAAVTAAKDKAMGDLEAISVETCQAIVKKLTGEELDNGVAAKAVKAELATSTGKGA